MSKLFLREIIGRKSEGGRKESLGELSDCSTNLTLNAGRKKEDAWQKHHRLTGSQRQARQGHLQEWVAILSLSHSLSWLGAEWVKLGGFHQQRSLVNYVPCS